MSKLATPCDKALLKTPCCSGIGGNLLIVTEMKKRLERSQSVFIVTVFDGANDFVYGFSDKQYHFSKSLTAHPARRMARICLFLAWRVFCLCICRALVSCIT